MASPRKGKETPAEQLLRMIEAPSSPESASKPTDATAIHRPIDMWRQLAGRLWRSVLPPRRELDTFLWNLRLAQRILWICLAGLGAYVIVQVIVTPSRPQPHRLLAGGAVTPATTATPTAEASNVLKPLPDYLAVVKARNPFTGQAAGSEAVKRTAKKKLEELVGGFTVVGIDRGPNPVALIENTSQQKTYMVKVGDEINGMQIKQINADGVVITYEGEEILLQ